MSCPWLSPARPHSRSGHDHPLVHTPDPASKHRLCPPAALTGLDFTASAYCQARSRLPLAVLETLLRRLIETCRPLTDTVGLWHGHRTWLVDGTGVSMPDRPALQRAFGQPTNQAKGCGFPVARVLALVHAGTGLLQHLIISPLCSHEMSRVTLPHPELRAGDLLIGDRAFGTFAHIALLVGRGLHGVFRMSQRRVVDFTPDRPQPPRWNTRKLTGRCGRGGCGRWARLTKSSSGTNRMCGRCG